MNYTEPPLHIIPAWGEYTIAMTEYLFSTTAMIHFSAMVPKYLGMQGMAIYCKPIAKHTYKVATWLAIVYGALLCVKGLLIGVCLILAL